MLFDLLQPAFAAHMVVDRDAGMDVRDAPNGALPARMRLAQRVDGRGHLDRVALGLHFVSTWIKRGEDGEIGGRAGIAGVGRKVEQHDADLAVGARRAAQRDQRLDARAQRFGALVAGMHVAGAEVGKVQFRSQPVHGVSVPSERPPKTQARSRRRVRGSRP